MTNSIKETILSTMAVLCLVVMLGIVGGIECDMPEVRKVTIKQVSPILEYKLIVHAGVDMDDVPSEWIEDFK